MRILTLVQHWCATGSRKGMEVALAFCVGLIFTGYTYGAVRNGTEKLLFRDLFRTYDTTPRPINNISLPVVIKFGVALNQILDLDEKKQVMTTSMWIQESWVDENLQWDPNDYAGLDTLMVASTYVWIPDIFIFNTAGGELDGFVNVTGSKLMIKSDGGIKWTVPLMIKSACSMDVKFFPYDSQRCRINFGSWIYDGTKIDLQAYPTKPDLGGYMLNSEFDLLGVTLNRTVANETCCPGPGSHPMINFGLRIKRKSIYYDYIVIAPTIMLCVLTLATFLLPCHHGEKISIGLTVFLTLYVLQLLIAENVPDTNTTPILGIFIFLVMTMNCISMIMATVVLIIKKHGGLKPVPMVPAWVMWFCETCLSKLVCTKIRSWDFQFDLCAEERDYIPPSRDRPCLVMTDPLGNQHHRMTDYSPETADTITGVYDGLDVGDYVQMNVCYNDSEIVTNSERKPQGNGSVPQCSSTHLGPIKKEMEIEADDGQCSSSCDMTSYRRMLRNRRSYRRALHTDDMEEETVSLDNESSQSSSHEEYMEQVFRINRSRAVMERKRQWYFVAEVVDKALFLVYLVSMFVTITTVLVIVPSAAPST
ncbi:neuronal acetylcholine receptor subunit alpha-10-like [Pecten maximus]|uniref:neuronal acetylcholine receptor subunit alpha-10-like n=1 Tax=Pecten maximus TaxID=6579 RepID=UPI001458E697|nr:neuronal acetylcholine receptor subunit alpha-10-like [Pecten maximus]